MAEKVVGGDEGGAHRNAGCSRLYDLAQRLVVAYRELGVKGGVKPGQCGRVKVGQSIVGGCCGISG